ncbi:MAG: universal stress protein [Pseudomonadota bacterium]
MRRFKRILVVYGDGESFGDFEPDLIGLAKGNGAEVAVTGWSRPPSPSLLKALFERKGKRPDELVKAGQQRLLEGHAERFRAAEVPVRTVVLEGDPLQALCMLIDDGEFDLVVKAVDGAKPDDHFTFGSFDRALVRLSSAPVMMAKPEAHRATRVLVAVDVSDPDEAALNEYLLEISTSQAEIAHDEVHVVHAWSLDGEGALRSGAFTEVSAAEIESLRDQEQSFRHQALQALLAKYVDRPVTIVEHLVEGPAPNAIAAVAERIDAEFLVMGAKPRRRVTTLVLSDCAETVLAAVDCSVLMVKDVPEIALGAPI